MKLFFMLLMLMAVPLTITPMENDFFLEVYSPSQKYFAYSTIDIQYHSAGIMVKSATATITIVEFATGKEIITFKPLERQSVAFACCDLTFETDTIVSCSFKVKDKPEFTLTYALNYETKTATRL